MSKKRHRSRRSEDEGPIRYLIRARQFVHSLRVALGVTSPRTSLTSEPVKKSPVLEGVPSGFQSEAERPAVEAAAAAVEAPPRPKRNKHNKNVDTADYLELYEAVRVALGPVNYQPRTDEMERFSGADEVVGRVHYHSVDVSEEKDAERPDAPYTGVYASLWESLRDALSSTGRSNQGLGRSRPMVSLNGSVNQTPQHASSSDSGSFRGGVASDRLEIVSGAMRMNSFADGLSVDEMSPRAPMNSADGSVPSSARLSPARELDMVDLEIRLRASTWNSHTTGRNWIESTVGFHRGQVPYAPIAVGGGGGGDLPAAPSDLSDGSRTPAVAGAWTVAPMTPMDVTEAPTPNEDAVGAGSSKGAMLTWSSLRDALANIQPSKNSSGKASNEDPLSPSVQVPQAKEESSREADTPTSSNNKVFAALISVSRMGSRSSFAHEIVAADLSNPDGNNHTPRPGGKDYDSHDI
jgi:hypothetical protein